MVVDDLQNCNKVEEAKKKGVESPETREVVKNLIENKLFMAEQKREKELQKRLETLRKHVGGWMVVSVTNWCCILIGVGVLSRRIGRFLVLVVVIRALIESFDHTFCIEVH